MNSSAVTPKAHISADDDNLTGVGGGGGGELLGEAMMAGGDDLAHLEVFRHEAAGAPLRAVADTPAPTTSGQLLRRLTVVQLRGGIAATAEAGNRIDSEGKSAASCSS